jgi:hypothetical protein
MRVHIETENALPSDPARVGNVYAVKGGRGLRDKAMNILIAITEPRDSYTGRTGLMLTVNREGLPVGVTSYAMHYVEDLSPIAFVEGIDAIDLTMRSL